jgi:sialate O-acetylesterase
MKPTSIMPAFTWICRALGLSLAVAFCPFASAAELSLPNRFGDHMVLQRDRPIPLAGSAGPGATVSVTLGASTASAQADRQGRWSLSLPAMPAGGPFELIVESGEARLQLEDVLIGEVWVGSGQSNMWMPLAEVWEAQREIEASSLAQVRVFTTAWTPSLERVDDVGGSWKVSEPANAYRFSALGYFFAARLHRELGVPVGFINISIGGTTAEAWTPLEVLSQQAEFAAILQRDAERRQQREAKGESPAHAGGAGHLFAGMVAPWTPFPIRGVVWYQGESNAGRARQYRSLLPTLIGSWRQAWKDPDLPFVIVQLPEFKAKVDEVVQPSDWAELRDAQFWTAHRLPDTHLAVLLGTGDAKDIHPKNKRTAGQRVAQVALAQVYNQSPAEACPQPTAFSIQGTEARVTFSHAASGLELRGAERNGFAIAGADRHWHPAEVRIEGEAVVLSSPSVAAPVAVRYAWADHPTPTLFNRAGMPATPFRTDGWPGVTDARE